jgi:hypothetical protein
VSSLAVSGIAFACIFGGAILGMVLRAILHEKHLTAEAKDLVKVGMGLVGTMTALVLGLMVASAKSSFDTQRTGLAQMSGNIIFLDRTLAHYGSETEKIRNAVGAAAGAAAALAHYGSETEEIRKLLRAGVEDTLKRSWPGDYPDSGGKEARTGTEGRYENIFEKIQELKPENDAQRSLQAQTLKTASDIAQARWLLFAQKGPSIPTTFVVVLVAWLALIFASFGLLAPPKPVVVVTLLISALVVSSAVFLILELDRPLDGLLQISSDPLRTALQQLEQGQGK